MPYTLMLRYYINGQYPAFFKAEKGEITTIRYAGQGMWVEPKGIFNSVEEALDRAEELFEEAECNFIRNGNIVEEAE